MSSLNREKLVIFQTALNPLLMLFCHDAGEVTLVSGKTEGSYSLSAVKDSEEYFRIIVLNGVLRKVTGEISGVLSAPIALGVKAKSCADCSIERLMCDVPREIHPIKFQLKGDSLLYDTKNCYFESGQIIDTANGEVDIVLN